MNAKTKDFIKRITANTGNEDDAYFVDIYNELNAYFETQPKEERDEFVRSGYGEMLEMCLPPETLQTS